MALSYTSMAIAHFAILPPEVGVLCISQDFEDGILQSKETLIVESLKQAQRLQCVLTDLPSSSSSYRSPVLRVVIKWSRIVSCLKRLSYYSVVPLG